jgi:hypothetical protein
MGWGDQGRQHQTRVSPSQSMRSSTYLHESHVYSQKNF